MDRVTDRARDRARASDRARARNMDRARDGMGGRFKGIPGRVTKELRILAVAFKSEK